jgi:hypothetical protein
LISNARKIAGADADGGGGEVFAEVRIFREAEREFVSKSKRAKHRKLPAKEMFPNLGGVKFEDAISALLKTPPPGSKKVKK